MSEKSCCRGPVKKLNLGCGSNRLEGWVNSDDDIRSVLSIYQANTIDEILVEHVVEHLSAPEMLRFFDECFRVLRKNGTLRVCVPTIKGEMTNDHRRDLILGHGHLQILHYDNLVWALQCAGFPTTMSTGRKEIDGHHRVIGVEKDDLETLRVEAVK
jgi:hypothetical protein